MWIALVAGFAMLLGDVAQSLYVILLDRGRARLAGFFDGLEDLMSVVAIGGGASTVFHHPIDLVTVVTFGLLLVGSVVGADVGNRLSSVFTRLPAVTESRI